MTKLIGLYSHILNHIKVQKNAIPPTTGAKPLFQYTYISIFGIGAGNVLSDVFMFAFLNK